MNLAIFIVGTGLAITAARPQSSQRTRMLATVALVIALLSFLNLAGLEKAVVAIVLAVRALRPGPGP